MKRPVLIALVIFLSSSSWAQTTTNSNVAPSRFRIFRSYVASEGTLPLIKSTKYAGVVPVENVDEFADMDMKYNLLMDLATGMNDSASANEINEGLAEVARAINTHIAAGVPKENLEVVVVVHGSVLKAFYNNEVFKEKYSMDNPNIPIFEELLALPVKFIACGQSIGIQKMTKDELVPWLKITISAQIPISTYQLKGFVLKKIETD